MLLYKVASCNQGIMLLGSVWGLTLLTSDCLSHRSLIASMCSKIGKRILKLYIKGEIKQKRISESACAHFFKIFSEGEEECCFSISLQFIHCPKSLPWPQEPCTALGSVSVILFIQTTTSQIYYSAFQHHWSLSTSAAWTDKIFKSTLNRNSIF